MWSHIRNKVEQMVRYYGYSIVCRERRQKEGKEDVRRWHSAGGVCPNSIKIGALSHNSSRSRQTGSPIVAFFTSPAGKNPPQPQDVDKSFPLTHNAIFRIFGLPKSAFLSLIPFGMIHVIRPGYSHLILGYFFLLGLTDITLNVTKTAVENRFLETGIFFIAGVGCLLTKYEVVVWLLWMIIVWLSVYLHIEDPCGKLQAIFDRKEVAIIRFAR